MMVVDAIGIPLAYLLDSVSPAEVTLIEKTIGKIGFGFS
jgi:hypothetical protein